MTGPKNQMDKNKGLKLNDDECVSQLELKQMMRAMTEAFKNTRTLRRHHMSSLIDELLNLLHAWTYWRLVPHHQLQPQLTLLWTTTMMTTMFMHRCDNASHVIDKVCEVMVDVVIIILNQTMIYLLRLSSLFHRFMGSCDAEAYLDREMTVEQKFNSHLVPEQHRVRQATSEFRDFAIIWWNELVNTRAAPQTWNALKEEMRAHFVPPSYRRDLRKNCNA
jgi:hypothetical protein